MAKKDLTEIVIVLDRSGSMASIRTDMEGGFNQFIAEQKEIPGDCLVTLAQFDDRYEVVYSGIPLKNVGRLSLVPRGGTALLDAIGKTIVTVGERLDKTPEAERPERVLFIIITDGQENMSQEWTRRRVFDLVKLQTDKYAWHFEYLGANQDALGEAGKLGAMVGAANFTADAQGTSKAMRGVSVGTRRYRSGGGYSGGN